MKFTTENIRAAYDSYKRGDHITNEQLEMLLTVIAAAVPFLEAHPSFQLMLREARMDLIQLDEYKKARKSS